MAGTPAQFCPARCPARCPAGCPAGCSARCHAETLTLALEPPHFVVVLQSQEELVVHRELKLEAILAALFQCEVGRGFLGVTSFGDGKLDRRAAFHQYSEDYELHLRLRL